MKSIILTLAFMLITTPAFATPVNTVGEPAFDNANIVYEDGASEHDRSPYIRGELTPGYEVPEAHPDINPIMGEFDEIEPINAEPRTAPLGTDFWLSLFGIAAVIALMVAMRRRRK